LLKSLIRNNLGLTRTSFPARAYLAALVLAVAAPALLTTGYLLMRYADAERTRLEEHLRDEARIIVSALDRRFAGLIEAMQVLAQTQEFDAQGLDDFYLRAGRARDVLGRNVILRDLDGLQLVIPVCRRASPCRAVQGLRMLWRSRQAAHKSHRYLKAPWTTRKSWRW
jgi:hypothetical protein